MGKQKSLTTFNYGKSSKYVGKIDSFVLVEMMAVEKKARLLGEIRLSRTLESSGHTLSQIKVWLYLPHLLHMKNSVRSFSSEFPNNSHILSSFDRQNWSGNIHTKRNDLDI